MLRTLEKAGLESKLPIYDDGRMIVEEGHLALKDEIKFRTRKYLVPYGLQEVESQQEGRKLDTTGVLYVPLTKPSTRLEKKWKVRSMPEERATNRDFSPGTTRELMQDLSGDDWANPATPPFGVSPKES